jgi:hypothetical protein
MNTLMLTGYAAVRMAQRGIKIKDADLEHFPIDFTHSLRA